VRSRLPWIIAIPVAALLLAMGGTWAYINVFADDAPARLTLEGSTVDTTATTAAAAAADTAGSRAPTSLDGTWNVTAGSQAGYRVDEVLFGQNVTAVGRTTEVDGSLTLSGTRVEAAAISIDLASVASDESRRDNQFRGRIMNVAEYPTATFRLTRAIDLGTLPADGATVTVPATGELTVRGVTKPVTVDLTAKRTGGTISVQGAIPVAFDDYGIPSPSFGPASVEDHGEIEFLVAFAKAG
jgi:polyisoprenoid-binding protein YceI